MPGLVSDALIDRLRSWGSAGSSAVQAMASTRSWQLCTGPGGDPEYVQPRHEEMAAFLASGHAKYSGSPGVCLSTQGPGAIHLLRSSSVWAPVSRCPWSGSRCCPQDAPWHTGVMGHLGTTASSELLAEWDTLLVVGCDDPWTEFYPKPGQARAVQIDIEPRVVGSKYPVDVALVGDTGETLRSLLPLLQRNPDAVGRTASPPASPGGGSCPRRA